MTVISKDAEEPKKWYLVKVTHEPGTGKLLEKPKTFEWKTSQEAQSHYGKLIKTGLKPHHIEVWSQQEGDQCTTEDGKPGHWVTLESGQHACLS